MICLYFGLPYYFPPFFLRQRHRYEPARKMERRPRMNEQITAPAVMLVQEDGAAEVLPIAEALERARAEEMDLIEVSPKAVPPVVKFAVRLRGREMANKDFALQKLKGIVAWLADVAEIEQEMKRQGDSFIVILKPKR